MVAFENRFGPVERDQSNGGGDPNYGQRMTIASHGYDHGIGVSAPSRADFYFAGTGTTLTARVGIDDETPTGAAVVRVLDDGKELFHANIAAGQPAVDVLVDVTGIEILSLADTPQEQGADPAHVDWADAVVRKA